MSLFLHLSDLHLVSPQQDTDIGDYKSEIVPHGERQRRQELLKNTLQELDRALSHQGKRLDAIIVTGDITNYGSPVGFEVLPDLLSLLGNSCPTRRVVVLPGNHDIVRDTEPSIKERYQHYSAFLLKNGFVSPALEGLDINPESGKTLKKTSDPYATHYLLDRDQKWLMVPVNCANYYGSLEPLRGVSAKQWEKTIAASHKDAPSDNLHRYLMDLRRRDVARVSPAQMAFVRQLMLSVEENIRREGDDPEDYVYLALLHHHLLPVSNAEEFKPFEALTNLGPFRQFLKANRFQVLLHGHKHVRHVYQDYIADASKGINDVPHRILVISGATLGSTEFKDQEVFRLVNLNARRHTPEISVQSVPAIHSGHSLNLEALTTVHVRLFDDRATNSDTVSAARYISARTASEVYARILQDTADSRDSNPLICQISEADSVSALAAEYPRDQRAFPHDPSIWLQEITDWWQCPTAKLGDIVPFNHGSRIRLYGNAIDQLGQVIERLQSSTTSSTPSSRATMVLLDPRIDGNTAFGRMYPSMCLVQFILRQAETGSRLDCIGYFRKQEIKYWWPINVAELAQLQKKVFTDIRHKHHSLELGTITTIAGIMTRSAGVPRVAIPAIDRAYDLHPEQLWDMVYSVFFPSADTNVYYQSLWNQYLDELMPDEVRDEDGVPIAFAGLEYLFTITQLFAKHGPATSGKQLADLIKRLIEINVSFAKSTEYGAKAENRQYEDWRRQVFEIIKDIKNALN